ncbi:protein-tyrosine-phosphatase [Penaeicola halotolerans]|uniref:protein-tyrosine-phosphatase n=1 Tax=Penaeicola halotolerans TaxID=2793196 RepID=UPI001CF90478|nr:protein-tyrosine-phosphatase [Penaeicola halotolerans]
MTLLLPALQKTASRIQYDQITADRLAVMEPLIHYIQTQVDLVKPIYLNFICTHNSRRSQISQIWAQTAASYFDIPSVHAVSGGTEATAFHPNAIEAMRSLGYEITQLDQTENPIYQVKYSADSAPLLCYSKVFSEAVPNDTNFAAVMTCDHADDNCPFIPEATIRVPLRYLDPKVSDGTAEARDTYINRALEIGSEIMYIFSRIKVNVK